MVLCLGNVGEEMEPDVSLLVDIVRVVCSAVRPLLGKAEASRIVGSGFGGDKTRLIDAVAEEAAIKYLEEKNLSCVFVGEECGVRRIGSSPNFYIIMDGVDGTNNAIRGVKFVSSSIALSSSEYLSDLEAAVVMDLYNGEIFSAKKGSGARHNGQPIKPSNLRSLRGAIISVSVSGNLESARRAMPVMGKVKGIRALGAASLEICYVASGHLDAYIDLRGMLRTIDFVAGMLILREAGGVFLQPNGDEIPNVSLTEVKRFSVVASANRDVFEEIKSTIYR